MLGSDIVNWLTINSTAVISLVAGIVIASFSILISRRTRKPYYEIVGNNVISDVAKYPRLKLIYGEQPINNLTATRFLFWNGGKKAIQSTDISSSEPLTLKAKDGINILEVRLIKQTRKANNAWISTISSSEAILSFELLNHNQGVVVEVLHSGTSMNDIKLSGFIADAGEPKHRSLVPLGLSPEMTTRRSRYPAGLILIGFPLILTILALFTGSARELGPPFYFTLIFPIPFWIYGYYVLQRRIPRELEDLQLRYE